jgi:hypothetical protein
MNKSELLNWLQEQYQQWQAFHPDDVAGAEALVRQVPQRVQLLRVPHTSSGFGDRTYAITSAVMLYSMTLILS